MAPVVFTKYDSKGNPISQYGKDGKPIAGGKQHLVDASGKPMYDSKGQPIYGAAQVGKGPAAPGGNTPKGGLPMSNAGFFSSKGTQYAAGAVAGSTPAAAAGKGAAVGYDANGQWHGAAPKGAHWNHHTGQWDTSGAKGLYGAAPAANGLPVSAQQSGVSGLHGVHSAQSSMAMSGYGQQGVYGGHQQHQLANFAVNWPLPQTLLSIILKQEKFLPVTETDPLTGATKLKRASTSSSGPVVRLSLAQALGP